ncbi:hypothetical protein [Streptomyces sp. NPDC050585]|uniref:hypothetical protein n=1 Tax=Streptomyces sp. NPDC050585 TaxID=3365632 RepID=UPI0037A9C6C5
MDAGKESPAGRPPSRRRSAVRPGGPVWPALLLATAVTVTGCAGGPSPQRAPAAQPPAGTQPAGPAPRTTATAPERSLLHRAEQELLRSCMATAGFEFRPVPENPLPEARDFPYVVDDVRWAQRYGYGGAFRERARRLRDQDPNRVYLRGLPDERRRAAVAALNGTPGRPGLRAELPGGAVIGHSADGCQVAAWRHLYGDAQTWFAALTLVDNLGGMRQRRVTADPAFLAAVPRWAACMRRHGAPYGKPADTRAAFLGGERRADPAREVRTAVQEARCAHSSGLAAVAGDLDRRHGEALRREHRVAVEQVAALRAAALPRARAVLAGLRD